MKILEYGRIKPQIVKCNHCGAILEYVQSDFKRKREIYYLVCPVCGGSILRDNNNNRFEKTND